jgi:hypothetical protein
MLQSVTEIRDNGLRYAKVDLNYRASEKKRDEEFHKHYGSTPLVLANMWYDLTTTSIPGAKLSMTEKTRGLKMFMLANYFLWNYPRNANILSSRFDVCLNYCRGAFLWNWIQKIAALKAKKIRWMEELDDPDAEQFVVSADGTDYRVWEKKHPTKSQNPGECSQKFNHGALKYQITMAVHHSKCVDIYGPCRGAESDKTLLKESGVLDRLKPNKIMIVDRGYINHQLKHKLSWPNAFDSPAVNNFKSRARLRGEVFNGCLKKFSILRETYRHAQAKHKYALEAVAVTVQYQMDNGAPLFSVSK